MGVEIRVDALGKQQVIMLQRERRLPSMCEVTAKGAWLLPHKHVNQTVISAPASLSRRGYCICLKFETNTHYELRPFSVAVEQAEVWWMRDGFYGINCRGNLASQPEEKIISVWRSFSFERCSKREERTHRTQGWAFIQGRKKLSKQSKDTKKVFQDDSYFFDNGLK